MCWYSPDSEYWGLARAGMGRPVFWLLAAKASHEPRSVYGQQSTHLTTRGKGRGKGRELRWSRPLLVLGGCGGVVNAPSSEMSSRSGDQTQAAGELLALQAVSAPL